MTYYFFGSDELKNILDQNNLKYMNNYVLLNSNNTSISRNAITHISTNNVDVDTDIYILGWTYACREEGFNDTLNFMSYGLDIPLTLYMNDTIYTSMENNISLSYLKQELYNQISNVCNEFMQTFRSDLLYNMVVKYTYMLSTSIFLQQYKLKHYFIDLEISETNPAVEDLLNIMYDRSEENEFEGILKHYQYLKRKNKNWLTYKDLITNVNNIFIS